MVFEGGSKAGFRDPILAFQVQANLQHRVETSGMCMKMPCGMAGGRFARPRARATGPKRMLWSCMRTVCTFKALPPHEPASPRQDLIKFPRGKQLPFCASLRQELQSLKCRKHHIKHEQRGTKRGKKSIYRQPGGGAPGATPVQTLERLDGLA